VIGVIGGLSTAILWSGAGTCSARMARAVGPLRSLAIGNLVGVIVVPLVALVWVGPPAAAAPNDWLGAIGYGFGATIGLAVIFRAYSTTKVGLVSATVSTNGAIAAVLSTVFLGEHLPLGAWLSLGAIMVGIMLAAYRDDPGDGGGDARRGMTYALLGAALFGGAVASGSTVDGLQPIWVVAIGRAIGLLIVTLPLALRRDLPRIDRSLAPYAIGSPVFDAAGFIALLVATGDGVAIPAVLSTGSAVLLAIAGALFFHERLSRLQWLGVATTVAGVAALTALRG
jgi:drug/metabolite transporter (DMT)-like permease